MIHTSSRLAAEYIAPYYNRYRLPGTRLESTPAYFLAVPGPKVGAVADSGGSRASGAFSPASSPGVDTVAEGSHRRQQEPRAPSLSTVSTPLSPSSSPHPSHRRYQPTPSHYAGDQPSSNYSSSGSSTAGGNHTTTQAMPDHLEMSHAKRRKVSVAGATRKASLATMTVTQSPTHQRAVAESSSPQLRGDSTPQGQTPSRRESESLEPGTSAPSPILSKPRRVRTGCLTCRNRHLKCDEAMPICLNCQKSNRKCERGVRLNFIDLKVEQPPYLLPPVDWKGMWTRDFPWSHVVGLQCVGLTCHSVQRSHLNCAMLILTTSPISR